MNYEINYNGGWIVPSNSTILANSVIPNYSELGHRCMWLGVTVESWLTLANVNGSGRQIKVIKHTNGVKIEAGYFIGTDVEFLAKAKSEGKLRYVAIIRAVVEAL